MRFEHPNWESAFECARWIRNALAEPSSELPNRLIPTARRRFRC
ncbi:UNVERIFIED_ORG: hypothetical protein QOE_0067 [Clostridioides difficile F501]